jgi:hypothetical protein
MSVNTVAAEGASLESLDMSDEDFMEMELPGIEDPAPEGEGEDDTPAGDLDDDLSTSPDNNDDASSDDGTEVDKDASDDVTDEGGVDTSDEDKDAEVDAEGEVVDTPEKEVELLPERLRTFKANGKDISIENVDEALQLMQMGANYGKKMTGLAPHLRMMKMLDNNGLLSEDKINRLIDLDKKDPAAIAALIKESGYDPLESSNEGAGDSYKPKTYNVGDQEVELDAAFDAIEGTSSYQETLKVVSTKWDKSSKEAIVADPSIIGTINAHIENGTYAQVQTVIDKERMLGRLKGVSDIEAYQQVGNHMQKNNMFTGQQTAPAKKPAAKKAVDPKVLKDKKRAAGSTKSSPGSKKSAPFDPLNATDEEILAMGNKF